MLGVAFVRISAAIVDCAKEELRQFDCKTRKLLTMRGGLHLKSDVDRLYLPRRSRNMFNRRLC